MRVEQMQKKVNEMEQKLNDADRYSRRYNLRVYGVAEEWEENIKVEVKEICVQQFQPVMVKQSWQQWMWLIALAQASDHQIYV